MLDECNITQRQRKATTKQYTAAKYLAAKGCGNDDKKVIRRWDSERELPYGRHRTRTTKYNGLTQCNGHYAVQGHSRSPILVPIESSYTTSYYWLILTYLLSYTVSKLWLIIGQIFASERGVLQFNALARVTPANIAINDISLKTRFFGLHFRCRKYWCIFNHFYVIRPESYRIRWNYAPDMAITPFKVI